MIIIAAILLSLGTYFLGIGISNKKNYKQSESVVLKHGETKGSVIVTY